MKRIIASSLMLAAAIFSGCASANYGWQHNQYQGRVLSMDSLDGSNYYSLLYKSAFNQGEKLQELGKPDFIYSDGVYTNYFIFKAPPRVVLMKESIAGGYEYTDLEPIPSEFKPYIYNIPPSTHAESNGQNRNLKTWDAQAMEHLGEGVEMNVKARKRGNEVFVLVEIEPASPELLKERQDSGFFDGASFTVNFIDEDGFTILEESFSLNSMTLIVDDNQEPLSFEYQGKLLDFGNRFESISDWKPSWRM